MSINLEYIMDEVVKLARRAGDFIRHEAAHFDHTKIEYKKVNDLVSYVDKEAEKMIVQTLKFTLPEAGFITEEGTAKDNGEEYKWVIDPLDGTTNFIHGLPFYSVSIALMHKKEVVIGVVLDVARNECFYAMKGGKAYVNRHEISVSKVDKFANGLYITGFPYVALDKIDNIQNLIRLFTEKTHGLRRLGSAAIDLAYVACGRSEGFYEHNLNPWDVAAGTLIVKQAGGVVTDLNGEDDYIFGKGIVAANNNVHAEMLSLIQKEWFK